ncbi:DegV family protein [Sutcliffiella sp. NPDC057660]|uniref:DegV family protein n=1 Tax=Sutcliffiella sp. NPDC057660 TaxID=3346199 RepID=UPI0036838A9F
MIKIMADSTCDLSDEVLEMHDISLASLTIDIEGEIYRDRVDIEPDEYYGMLEALSEHPTTGMPSPTEYLSIIK